MKIILGEFNAEFGKESYLYPTCEKHSLIMKQMINFAMGRDLAVAGTWYNIRIFIRSLGDHLITKYITR
jgi:hypothetical protein